MLLKVLINENKIQIKNIDRFKLIDAESKEYDKKNPNVIAAERPTSKKKKKMPKTQNAK